MSLCFRSPEIPFRISSFALAKLFFSDVTLFDFQSSFSFALRAKCFAILSHLISFVKYFFQLFSNFFDVVRLARTDDIISYSLPFVNIFFQKILTNGEGGI